MRRPETNVMLLPQRRGWDSNPRMTLTAIAGFQDRSALAQQSPCRDVCAPFRALHAGLSCSTMDVAAMDTHPAPD